MREGVKWTAQLYRLAKAGELVLSEGRLVRGGTRARSHLAVVRFRLKKESKRLRMGETINTENLVLDAMRLAERAHRTRPQGPHHRKAPEGEDRPAYFIHLAQVGCMLVIAGLGVAGAGLALAMQGVLSNLVAGLNIVFTLPYCVGK